MMKRGVGKIVLTIFFISLLLIIPLASAGFWSDFKARITGNATFDINISVTSGTAPTIPWVFNSTDLSVSGPNEGPVPTYFIATFTAYDADGFGNLNDGTALINISKSGEETRENASCSLVADYQTNYANYTCNMTMWWWDGTGSWNITAYIVDSSSNPALNSSATTSIGTTTGFEASPTSMNFDPIAPGTTDELSTSNPMLFNNTGNLGQYIEVNSTDLVGEANPAYALWAGNFSAKVTNACEGNAMINQTFVNITDNILPTGNYTIADGTAQEQLYFCLELAGGELIPQYYSTLQEGSWTTKIITT